MLSQPAGMVGLVAQMAAVGEPHAVALMKQVEATRAAPRAAFQLEVEVPDTQPASDSTLLHSEVAAILGDAGGDVTPQKSQNPSASLDAETPEKFASYGDFIAFMKKNNCPADVLALLSRSPHLSLKAKVAMDPETQD